MKMDILMAHSHLKTLRAPDTLTQYRDIQYADYIKCEQALLPSNFVCSHLSTTYSVSLRLLNITQKKLWTMLSKYHSIDPDNPLN